MKFSPFNSPWWNTKNKMFFLQDKSMLLIFGTNVRGVISDICLARAKKVLFFRALDTIQKSKYLSIVDI